MTNYEKLVSEPKKLRNIIVRLIYDSVYWSNYARNECHQCRFYNRCLRSESCGDTIGKWLEEEAPAEEKASSK